jgi:polyisoprenoid-binding protein YceI
MTEETSGQMPAERPPSPSRKRRHWWRWILAAVAALLVLGVAGVVVAVDLQPTLAPLALPAAAASAPVGPIEGTWEVAAGSLAGFRLRETVLWASNDVVGRTNELSGTVTISGDEVIAASFSVDLVAITVQGKTQPELETSLDTRLHPYATLRLTQPVRLSPASTAGAVITATAVGQLSMHGISRPVTFLLSARRDGAVLQAAGSIPVALSDWGVEGPVGFGFLGSLADHGVAEFLLVLRRQ